MSETGNEVSRSKQKRLEQEKNRSISRRKKAMARFWSVAVPAIIILAIVVTIIVYRASRLDYSRYYTDTGALKGITASEHVSVDTAAMKFAKSELLPDDDTVQADIDSDLASNQYVSDDAGLSAQSGDKLRISYSSTIDGEAYNEEPDGTDYTIGSASIDSAFDDALIGHAAGDDFSVDVSFPEDYSDESAAGKTATYSVHLQGIYVDPVFDDAYVQEYHGDVASTTEEYRQSIIDGYYEENLEEAVSESISVNSVVSSIPGSLLKNTRRTLEAQDLEQMEYMNSMYQQMLGYSAYNNVYESRSFESREEYEADLDARAKEAAERILELQYIADRDSITVDDAEVLAYYLDQGYTEERVSELKESYGAGYVARSVLEHKILHHLMDTVTIE